MRLESFESKNIEKKNLEEIEKRKYGIDGSWVHKHEADEIGYSTMNYSSNGYISKDEEMKQTREYLDSIEKSDDDTREALEQAYKACMETGNQITEEDLKQPDLPNETQNVSSTSYEEEMKEFDEFMAQYHKEREAYKVKMAKYDEEMSKYHKDLAAEKEKDATNLINIIKSFNADFIKCDNNQNLNQRQSVIDLICYYEAACILCGENVFSEQLETIKVLNLGEEETIQINKIYQNNQQLINSLMQKYNINHSEIRPDSNEMEEQSKRR